MLDFIQRLFGGGQSSVPSLDPAEAHARVRRRDLLLIDVRTKEEWRTGVAKGAKAITLGDPCMVDTIYTLLKEDASKPVAVICRSGMRSGRAAKMLAGAGFTNVSNIKGGMMAWTAAGLPTQGHRS